MTTMNTETGPFEYVYGIHEGSIHEGGSIGNEVYRDIRIALQLAEQVVKTNQEEQEQLYTVDNPKYGELPHDWKPKGDGRWTNGIEEVRVIELKVI